MIDLGAWNPRDPVVAFLNLVEIDTADGTFRFIVGADGAFTDTRGFTFCGSTLIGMSRLESALNGIAPSGSLTLSFFQDPNAPNLVAQMRALGTDYVLDREVRFLLQPIGSHEEFEAPTAAPVLIMTRTSTSLTFAGEGPDGRSITLGFEAATFKRRSARRVTLNTDGHATLLGRANPSLQFMPQTNREDEKLFG